MAKGRLSVAPWPLNPASARTAADSSPLAIGNWAALVLFLVLGFGPYSFTLSGGPQIDDWVWFDSIKHGGIMGADHTALHLWRPLVSIVFWSIWKVFGFMPAAYRVFNVLTLVIAAYAVRAIWIRLCPEKNAASWTGFAAGLLFMLWPAHVETVAWIAGMTDGLCIALGMAGIWSYLIYRQDGRIQGLIVSLVLFTAAMLVKEAAAPFPVIAFGLGASLVEGKRGLSRFKGLRD